MTDWAISADSHIVERPRRGRDGVPNLAVGPLGMGHQILKGFPIEVRHRAGGYS